MASLEDYFGSPTNTNGLCLLDLSGVAVAAAKMQAAMFNTDTVEMGFLRHMILNSLLSNRKKFRHQYPELVIACDAKNNWRKKKHPFYKAHRQASKDADTSFDWDHYFSLFNVIKEEIRQVFPFKMIEVEGAEGDDVVGALAAQYPNRPTLIHAKDSDFNQCCRLPHVKIWNPFKQTLGVDAEAEKNLFEKICRGDKGDGIPNILSVTNSFVDGIRQKQLRDTRIEEYRANGLSDPAVEARFKQNQELIDFRYMPDELRAEIVSAYENAKSLGNKQTIYAYLTQKDLAKISATFLADIEALA